MGSAEGYPPAGMLKPPPVRGYVIPPESSALDSYQIVVGVRAKEPGVHTIPGFEIQYHADQQQELRSSLGSLVKGPDLG